MGRLRMDWRREGVNRCLAIGWGGCFPTHVIVDLEQILAWTATVLASTDCADPVEELSLTQVLAVLELEANEVAVLFLFLVDDGLHLLVDRSILVLCVTKDKLDLDEVAVRRRQLIQDGQAANEVTFLARFLCDGGEDVELGDDGADEQALFVVHGRGEGRSLEGAHPRGFIDIWEPTRWVLTARGPVANGDNVSEGRVPRDGIVPEPPSKVLVMDETVKGEKADGEP